MSMASGSYWQVFVQCPFYRQDDGRSRIHCEWMIDHSTVSINFQRRPDFITQIQTFCCGCYDKCEIYRMLMVNKYEEEDL